MDLLEAICDGSSITQMAKLHQHTCRCLDGQLADLLQQHMETGLFALFISIYRYFWLQFSGCHLTSAKMTCYCYRT